MAMRDETDWQSEKTLVECMQHMLDNEIATDVCFEVGPPDDTTVILRAHKYMLISRSPVFEAMFSSGMSECKGDPEAKVRVEDIDAPVFKELLTYMYCETISLSPESAASLMYAAHKYMLPKLVRECGKCLLEILDVNNVINILEHAIIFHDKELTTECLKLISLNSETILTSVEILSASRQVMQAILELDIVSLSEPLIYEICINWATYQLQNGGLTENPTDAQIREKLGDLLYKIRFPTMRLNVFAEISAGKNVLNAEEKESIYYFLSTKKKGSELMFPTKRRHSEEVWIDRTVTCTDSLYRSTPSVDAINFTVNQDVLLTGIGLFTGFKGKEYAVDLEILLLTRPLYRKRVKVQHTGDSNVCKILLDEPIFIHAGLVHAVKALSHDAIGHYGHPFQAVCTKGKVKFTFSNNSESPVTNTYYGQIPRFYFCYV